MRKEMKYSVYNGTTVRHVSLTHLLRHNKTWGAPKLSNICARCDVKPFAGNLPPQLRARVPKQHIAWYTVEFHNILNDFVMDMGNRINYGHDSYCVSIDAITKLFGTKCNIEYHPMTDYKWRDEIATICRISFPDINAQYALRIPRINRAAEFEYDIQMSFSASRAEPKDNSKIYMASPVGGRYMLLDWGAGHNNPTGNMRNRNDNQIFYNCYAHETDSIRGGRFDLHNMHRTRYGALSYSARKIYRKIKNAARHGAPDEIQFIRNLPTSYISRHDIDDAIFALKVDAGSKYQNQILEFLESYLAR